MTSEIDIVIVGTGAAGIGAARGLAGSGLSVMLIDALPRLGGRAWTTQAAGVPLDMGCAYLHSAERNPWVAIAGELGHEVDRSVPAFQKNRASPLFSSEDRVAARRAFNRLNERMVAMRPASDCAADLLDPEEARWTPYIQAVSGYVTGDEVERISVADIAAYEAVSTDTNWRLPCGYGTLVAAGLPGGSDVHLGTPLRSLALTSKGVALETPGGRLTARAAILTVSTSVLAGGAIDLPPDLDPWRDAAAGLPLGNDEKLYFQIVGDAPFEAETQFHGNPEDPASGAFYIRPHDKPVIECFLGGAGARAVASGGHEAAFARALDQLAGLFGTGVRRHLRPLVASDWAGTPEIGGGYSHALPGKAAARPALARPFDDRVFFAGEATHVTDYSTAHGALMSGLRAADEARAALTV